MPFPAIAGAIGLALKLAPLVPSVVGMLGGSNAEKVAERVVGIAEAVTGKSGDDAVSAVLADPALALKLEQAYLRQETQLEQMYLAGVQGARDRDIEVRKITGGTNWRADVLAVGALLGLIGLIWTLLFVHIPDGPARDTLLILSGALVAIVKDVYQFEFGSSRGSKEKSEAMRRQ
jgi:hypothetical protein